MQHTQYRPDIDGLRAIAVLAVVFFHTSVPGFSGGFVGVDIFFVISGFLITSIILNDVQQGRFSITEFYERRIRRIFPALFSMMAFTLLGTAYLFDPMAFRNFGKSIIATTLFVSNIFFWQQSGYFEGSSLLKPLLHTWSLAVEEQFYILFPIAIHFIQRSSPRRQTAWVSAFFLISLTANLIGFSFSPNATFYLVHSRAWELLAGSLLALGALPKPSGTWSRQLLSLSGLGLIIFSIGFFDETTPFPGYHAIPPVLGAVLILQSHGDHPALVNRVLSTRPLVGVGLVSYSLYLWHWPIVSFSKYLSLRPFTVLESVWIVLASLGVSILSWRFIEQPFRMRPPLLPGKRRLFSTAAIVLVVATVFGEAAYVTRGMPSRIEILSPDLLAKISKQRKNHPWLKAEDWEDIAGNLRKGVAPPRIGAENTEPSFALVGDSHATALIPAFAFQAHEAGVCGIVISLASVPFLTDVHWYSVGAKDSGWDRTAHNKAVMTFLEQHSEIRTVFLVSRWAFYIHGPWRERTEEGAKWEFEDLIGEHPSNPDNQTMVAAGLRRTVEALLKLGRNVVLLSDVPEVGYDAPRAFYISQRWPGILDLETIRPSMEEYIERQKAATGILEDLGKLHGVTVIHPETRMFDAKGLGRVSAKGELLYEDDDHLSMSGALEVAPVLEEVFHGMAPRGSDTPARP